VTKEVTETGTNFVNTGGVGLALCERLLSEDGSIQLCLACRNLRRAQAACSALLTSHPDAQVALLQLDTSSISSVLTAAHDVKLYNRLDYLYLNAGIMPNPQLDVKAFCMGLFSSHQHVCHGGGLQEMFATNLFGHFLLVRELLPVLCQANHTSQVIWTSSSNAQCSAFSLKGLQHQTGTEPYNSSKYASDLLSLALNTHLNMKGLYSSVICPGFAMTNLTYGILPSFPKLLWNLLMPILWLVCVSFDSSVPLFIVQFWLFMQKPESLDPWTKYQSNLSPLLCLIASLFPSQMDTDGDMSEALYDKLLELEDKVHRKLKEEKKAYTKHRNIHKIYHHWLNNA
uniref:Hydroxysteroid (17-beta) dehydrogenase 7 n=1 Tax=Salmo trutta TaxID=8032 RepID=A0A673VWA3_SALTR